MKSLRTAASITRNYHCFRIPSTLHQLLWSTSNRSVWKLYGTSAKCLLEGYRYPTKLETGDFARLNNTNIRKVISEFNGTFESADSGDKINQTNCLGIGKLDLFFFQNTYITLYAGM